MLWGQHEPLALFFFYVLKKFTREAVLNLFAKLSLGLAPTEGAGNGPAESATVLAVVHAVIVIG